MNPIKDINYLALDLELNNKNDGSIPKIIQVGVAIGSPKDPDNIKLESWYIDPGEPIEPRITELTGITNDTIKACSVSHSEVAANLATMITKYKPFVNPVTWGQGDALELLEEFKDKGIHSPFFGRRIIDVKTIYVMLEQVNGRSPSGGLKKSMNRYGCKFLGDPHVAPIDAFNTLRFYFHLMQRQRKLENMVNEMKSISY